MMMGREYGRADFIALLRELTCTEFDMLYRFYMKKLTTEQFRIFAVGQQCASVFQAAGNSNVKAEMFHPGGKAGDGKRVFKTEQEQIAIWRSM